MSVRHGLLALFQRGPMHGYQLHAAFTEVVDGTYPLNIGQVYSTLSRLERDGLIRALDETESRQQPYETTDAGSAELASWFDTPVPVADRPHYEAVIKLVLAANSPGIDAKPLIEGQRTATAHAITELTSLKEQAAPLPTRLMIDGLIFRLEAELQWLDSLDTNRSARLALPGDC